MMIAEGRILNKCSTESGRCESLFLGGIFGMCSGSLVAFSLLARVFVRASVFSLC